MNLQQPLRATLRIFTRLLERRLVELLYPAGTQPADFLSPVGEPSLLAVDSVSWRVFGNPVALTVGGITAVLMELAEPRVRTGVWQHSTFRTSPLARLQRTGYATMMTAFGARSRAQAMIDRINAGHARIAGHTPGGLAYNATDIDLLTWVHATAIFGFLEAYATCVRTLDDADRDRHWADNRASARLYGVPSPPGSTRDFAALLETMLPRLEPSEIVLEFLAIMRRVPLLPAALRPLQFLLIRVAVQNVPAPVRDRLGLTGDAWRVAPWQWRLLRAIGRATEHLSSVNLPAVLARRRLAAAHPD